ncbi:MAG: secretin N-terminal domain-containing protein [Desulfomonilaceae bacterium]
MPRFFSIIICFVLILPALSVVDISTVAGTTAPVSGSSQTTSSISMTETMSEKSHDLQNVRLSQRRHKFASQKVQEPECFEIGETKKCFYYEVIKIRNGLASEISRVLQRLFNNQCSDASRIEVDTPQDQGFIAILEELYDRHSAHGLISVPSRNRRGPRNLSKLRQQIERRHSAYTGTSNAVDPTFKGSSNDSSVKLARDRDLSRDPVIWHDDQNSLIFIKDTASRIRQIKKIIESLDKPAAQIRIESRIVRANKDWSRGVGILWGGRNNQFGGVKTDRSSYWGITGNQSGTPGNTATGANLKQTIFQKGVQQLTSRTITSSEIPSRLAVNLPANVANIGDIMGLGLQFGLLANQYITELDFRLQIGEAQGQARTVARPNIQVSDGKNAVIKSGSVLNVQTSSPQWGTNAELVEVCLKLQVTPKILSDGRIKMMIVVTDNEPNIMPTTGELYLEREAHTTMTVRDGETCVIGGIIRETAMGRREGWPGLMNLPIVGMLFSNKTKAKEIDELLVFINPKVVFRPNK